MCIVLRLRQDLKAGEQVAVQLYRVRVGYQPEVWCGGLPSKIDERSNRGFDGPLCVWTSFVRKKFTDCQRPSAATLVPIGLVQFRPSSPPGVQLFADGFDPRVGSWSKEPGDGCGEA